MQPSLTDTLAQLKRHTLRGCSGPKGSEGAGEMVARTAPSLIYRLGMQALGFATMLQNETQIHPSSRRAPDYSSNLCPPKI